MVCHSLAYTPSNFAALKNANMMTTKLTKALVRYLMAMTLPQELGILHTPKEENPFISVKKRTGKKTCRLDDSDLERFKEETGIELSRAEILSCATMKELENLVGSKAGKVSMETLSGMILNLTSTLGTIWNNLELVESLDEISDGGIVDPSYVWPIYNNLKLAPAEKDKLEKECEGRVIFGRLRSILS